LSGEALKAELPRKLVQFVFFVFFCAGVFGVKPRPVILPILIPARAYGRTMLGAFSAMQLMLSKPVFPFIPIASFLLVGVLFGRAMCGWLCPFGFVQDLLAYVKRRHWKISPKTHQWMVDVKYYVALATLTVSGTLAISLALGVGEDYKRGLGALASGPFDALSPHETLLSAAPKLLLGLEAAIPWLTAAPLDSLRMFILSIPPLLWARLAILAVFLVSSVYVPRFFCKYICPVGALMAVVNRFSFLGLSRNPVRCTKCRRCVEVCPMDVKVMTLPGEKINDPECIYCLRCIQACEEDALSLKFP